MMPAKFLALDGIINSFDLDNVYDVIEGFSEMRAGWEALIVYEPKYDTFVELRDAPPDIRGGQASEVEEITVDYLKKHYGLTGGEIRSIRSNPANWKFMSLRNQHKGK